MKRKLTSILLLITLVLTTALSAGCSKEELALLSAVQKLATAKSYAQNSKVSFAVDFSCNDEYTGRSIQQMASFVQSMAYNTSVRYNGDRPNGQFKAAVSSDVSLDPITVSSDMWMDLDMNSENPKYQIVVRVPELFKAFLPEAYCKDYLNIDYIAYMDWLAEEMGAESTFDVAQYAAMEENLAKLFALVCQNEKLSSNLVLMSNTTDGLTKLTLKVSDAQLKTLVLTIAEELKTNDELLSQVTTCAAPFASSLGMTDQPALKKMLLDGINEALPVVKEYFAANKILGSNGLRYEVLLNADGYIVDETLVINGYVDKAPLAQMMYTDDENFEGYVDFTVTMKNEYTGINEEVALDYPVLTAANSIDLVETMKAEAIVSAEASKYSYFPITWHYSFLENEALNAVDYDVYVDFPLKGTFNGKPVNTTIQITDYKDFCYYMPLRQAAQIFGGTIDWDADLLAATWTVDGETVGILTPISNTPPADWPVDDELYGHIHNGTTYINMSNIEYFLGVDFGYDVETDTILLR